MDMTKKLQGHAILAQRRGEKQGHDLTSWYSAQVVFDETQPPAQVAMLQGTKLKADCVACGAWVALLNEDGHEVSSNSYDAPCKGPERPADA